MSIYEYDEEKHMQQERRDAKEAGMLQNEISLLCKKIKKGKSVSQIADDLEADLSYIEKLYETAQRYAPEYDEEKILHAILSKKQ